METWEKLISSSHHRHPSFSSTLLDQIYRSIDDSPPRKKKQYRNAPLHDHRQISPVDFLRHSNSSSSDSSAGFSSSESDSFYGRSKSSTSPPPPTRQQPKPIRTSSFDNSSGDVQKPKELGGFRRTKSKALKIYSDLKKVKQPISPGGRLATFLNSLFTNSSAATKPKKTTTASSSSTTTCSSASSFSRSCLSKTPSSSGKSKRSVRFCPVNVILDEDSSMHIPYGYNNNRNSEPKGDVMEEHCRVIEAAKDLLRTYHKNKTMMTTCDDDDVINVEEEEEEEEDDDEDDAASYASSDLFELENLSAIGIERYREELPVYETTRLDNTNRPIPTTLIV